MKYAADFRRIARAVLAGRWRIAVIAGLIASLLGGVSLDGPELTVKVNENNGVLEIAGMPVHTLGEGVVEFLVVGAAVIFLVALIIALAYAAVGSVARVGYCRFNLDLVDGKTQPRLNTVVSYFPYWKTTFVAKFLRGLYVSLWTMLFIVPGIMAEYSYAMTDYILAEHPELTASEAIAQSKQMMYGNRWRLFCLEMSFIGWNLLCVFSLGIGNLWLTPYKQAAQAAFYRDVSGTEYILDPGE